MPQPLNRVVPKPGLGVFAEAAERHPERAAQVASIFAHWATVEVQLGQAFGHLMGSANIKQSLALFYSFSSFDAQLKSIQKIMDRTSDPEDARIYIAFRKAIIGPAHKERNRLAHWSWAECSQLPDAILLVDPADLTQFYMISQFSHMSGSLDPTDGWPDISKILVYTSEDLERIKQQIMYAHKVARMFVGLCVQDQPSYVEQRARLSCVPEIARYLARP